MRPQTQPVKPKSCGIANSLINKQVRRFIVFLGLWSIVYGLWSTSAQAYEVSEVVATVNNEVITTKDLSDYCEILFYQSGEAQPKVNYVDPVFRREALDQLIEDTLILDQAKKEKDQLANGKDEEKALAKKIDEQIAKSVDKKINEIIVSAGGREVFEKSLEEKGLALADLRKKIGQQMLIAMTVDKCVRDYVGVSPQEISAYYDGHAQDFKTQEKSVVWVAVSDDNKLLDKVARFIRAKGADKAGTAFKSVMTRMEADIGQFNSDISSALATLSPGESILKKSGDKIYLIHYQKKIESRALTLEEASSEIQDKLYQEKFKKKMSEWVDSLRNKAAIQVFLTTIRPVPAVAAAPAVVENATVAVTVVPEVPNVTAEAPANLTLNATVNATAEAVAPADTTNTTANATTKP